MDKVLRAPGRVLFGWRVHTSMDYRIWVSAVFMIVSGTALLSAIRDRRNKKQVFVLAGITISFFMGITYLLLTKS